VGDDGTAPALVGTADQTAAGGTGDSPGRAGGLHR